MILIIDMNREKSSLGLFEFVQPIVSAVEKIDGYTVMHYKDVAQEDLAQYDITILSGTPLKDNATLSQLDKFEWLKTWDKPALGICAGFQTIGLLFGASLKRCLGIGMTEITTLQTNALFSSKFNAYTLHNYSIESGDAFENLAESPQCIQAIKHKKRDVYGVLFHPEVRNPEILRRFVLGFGRHRRV